MGRLLLFLLLFCRDIRVDMHHAVLDGRKMRFDRIVDVLRRVVRFDQRFGGFHQDLDLHIDLRAEQPRFQFVNAQHAVRLQDDLPHLLHGLIRTGLIDHFIHGIAEDLNCGFLNEHADDDARQRVKDGHSHSRANEPTDESASER